MKQAHTLEEIVDAGWAPSVLYLQRRLRRGEITGKKVGRVWKMSDEDVAAYLDSLSNSKSRPVAEQRFGLSSASMRRRSA